MNLLEKYYEWLLYSVNFNDKGYNLLMKELFNSPFEVVLERDNNRIDDCMALREQFLYGEGLKGDFLDFPANILELLVSLAIRIDNEYIGNPNDPHPEIIFWEMICNLGLDKFDNLRFNSGLIYEILGVFVGRKYDKNGNGGLFPLPKTNTDQREIELASQMKAYLNIHYF